MNTNIFIPEKLKVGFQKRSGTYTGKLAYIIYIDAKGKLRKEKSWNSWRQKYGDRMPTYYQQTKGKMDSIEYAHFVWKKGSNNDFCKTYVI